MKRVLAIGAALVGCGRAAAPPVVVPPQPAPAPIVVDAAPPAPAPAPTWSLAIEDYERFDIAPLLLAFARPEGFTLLTVGGSLTTSDWARRTGDTWARASIGIDPVVGATFDRAGAPWLLVVHDRTLMAQHAAAPPEIVMPGFDAEMGDTAAIALDDGGRAHICIATGQGTSPPGYLLAYAHQVGQTSWVTEKVPAHARGCTIAVAPDGRVAIGTREGVATKPTAAGGGWQTEALAGQTVVARAPDGTIVAAGHGDRDVQLARYAAGAWTHAVLAADVGADVMTVALAVDAHGRAHVALHLFEDGVGRWIKYAVEGGGAVQTIARADAMGGLAIAIGDDGEPVVAFAATATSGEFNKAVVVARHGEAGAIAHDTAGLLAACGRLVDDELGAEPALTAAELRRDHRLCAMFAAEPDAAPDALVAHCHAGSATACLVGAATSGKQPRALAVFELTAARCGKARCTSTRDEVDEVGGYLPKLAVDEARATDLFAAACAAGDRGACLAVHLASTDIAEIAPLCSPALPIACAKALESVAQDPAIVADLRAALTAACKTSTRPVACNALAFMDEAAGDKQGALANHVRACALYSATSCITLLVGPLGRARAPKDLDRDRFTVLLDARCTAGDVGACRALAAAYERGWVVARDRAAAAAVRARIPKRRGTTSP